MAQEGQDPRCSHSEQRRDRQRWRILLDSCESDEQPRRPAMYVRIMSHRAICGFAGAVELDISDLLRLLNLVAEAARLLSQVNE